MEEIIEYLREYHQTVATPLELPDDDKLLNIEEQLFIKLEGDFRNFLLFASDLIIGSLEPVTAADPSAHTFLPEVAANNWDRGMPRHLLPLCETVYGCYCINEEGQVLYWQQDASTDEEQAWDNVWEWAQQVWIKS